MSPTGRRAVTMGRENVEGISALCKKTEPPVTYLYGTEYVDLFSFIYGCLTLHKSPNSQIALSLFVTFHDKIEN